MLSKDGVKNVTDYIGQDTCGRLHGEIKNRTPTGLEQTRGQKEGLGW